MELNKIYNQDCIEYMKTLPNDMVNLIIADAPYFSTNIKEVGDRQWGKEEDYIDWVIENFKEYERILKNNGSLYFFHNDINLMVEILYRIKKETNLKLKNQITWDKLATGNQDFLMPLYKNSKLKRRYATSLVEYIYYFTFSDNTGLTEIYDNPKCFERIRKYLKEEKKKSGLSNKDFSLMFSEYTNKKGCANRSVIEHYFSNKQWTFPTEDLYKNVLQKTGFFNKDYSELKQEYDSLRLKYESLRYVFSQPYLNTPKDVSVSRNIIRPYSTVWHYKRDDEVYTKHLTPKPVDMIKHILNTSSNEGDLVYIPFAGSGSDIVACIETGRNYIATETNNDYIEDIIKPRLSKLVV